MPGATVAIEDPTAMRLLDILEDRGARPLPVACDAEGPLPEALAQALAHKPTAFVYQPRTHSVTGRRVSPARLDALAAVLAESDTLIIEDDGIGEVSPLPPASLGSRFPDRVIHILSFSKSHGPDLRLAVLSAPAAIRRQIQSYRSFSSGWTSRLLQSFLYGVGRHDPWTLVLGPTLLLLSGVCAAMIPAGRAASIDPMQALRME